MAGGNDNDTNNSGVPIMSNLTREAKGRDIAENNGITELPGGAGYYVGDYHINSDATECSCNDFVYRGGRCKHLCAVDYAEAAGLIGSVDRGYDDGRLHLDGDAEYPIDLDDLPF